MELVNFSQEAILNRLLVQVFFFFFFLEKVVQVFVCLGMSHKIGTGVFFFFRGTVCVTTYWACKVDSPKKEKNLQSTAPIWSPIIN